jgi:molybdopterin converting factor small subunit
MNVHLKVLLPMLPEAMGGKESQVEFAGETVKDLIEHLVEQYGRQARQALYDRDGQLDPVVQILLNGEQWVTHDRLDTVLHDGDDVMLALMLAGG